jgi:hypothetical protein
MKRLFLGLLCVVTLCSLLGNYLLFERYSSSRSVALVNDQVIRRKDLDDRLDCLYTTNVLRQMILTSVIVQAAQKANCMPTTADVAAAEQQMERTEPTILTQARTQDPTLTIFSEQIKSQLALRNLRIQSVSVSDSQARAFYAAHQSQFHLPAQSQTTLALAMDSLAAQSTVAMLQNGESAEMVAKQPGVRVVGINAAPISSLPDGISHTVLQMKSGQVRSFPVGGHFVVVRIEKAAPATTPSYQTIRPQVEIDARLAKAPPVDALLARLVADAQIKIESDKYAAAAPQVGSHVASAAL